MNVFIGGSRAVPTLNTAIRSRIDDVIIGPNHTVLIGDANGADKAVQRYLAECRYPNVVVFCIRKPRHNIGAWPTRIIEPPSDRKNFAYYAAKDSVMANEAKCGVMLWDGRSRGTLNNILNLIAAGKRVLVYLSPTMEFYVLASREDLQALRARGEKGPDLAARDLKLKSQLVQNKLPLV